MSENEQEEAYTHTVLLFFSNLNNELNVYHINTQQLLC